MDPFIIRRGIAGQIANHYVANYTEVGPQSIRELARLYGCSDETMRSAMRMAESLLRGLGRTPTVPEGHKAWRIEVTDDQRTFVASTVGRIKAMASELARYTADEIAVTDADTQRLFGDVPVAVELLVESLNELTPA